MKEKVFSEKQGSVAVVWLNREEAYNAFDLPMITELADTLTAVSRDPAVRGVVLAGKGRAFCAGGDLKWALDFPGGASAAFHTLAAQFHRAILEIRRMAKPVAAALNGPAAGGGFSLALACDFRVMEENAVLRQAYTSNGLCIDGGGTFMLPRLVGLARAMEIAAFDEPISPSRALELGLVNQVAKEGRAVVDSLELVGRVARGSLSSFASSKRLLNDSFDTPLEVQLEKERKGLADAAAHPDGREGLDAFSQKRKPDFSKHH